MSEILQHAISRTNFIVECVGERLGLLQFGHVVSRRYLPHVRIDGDRTCLVHTHQQHAVCHLGGRYGQRYYWNILTIVLL